MRNIFHVYLNEIKSIDLGKMKCKSATTSRAFSVNYGYFLLF